MSVALRFGLTLFVFLAILILSDHTHGRFISFLSSSTSSDLVSDGVRHCRDEPNSVLLIHRPSGLFSEATCEQTYGFLPCSTTVLGNLFLIVVYGFLMFKAAFYMSEGSELLLEILGPGIVGGLFLPFLGAFPDAILILVSGLSSNKEAAQSQISIGMGLLAGSTVLLLTIIWGSCVIVGKCDIVDGIAQDDQDTNGFILTGSGVGTDIWTNYAGRIMVISVIPFLIVQLPQMLNSASLRSLAVLIALVVSLSLLIVYCIYQTIRPWIQRRKLAYVKQKHVVIGLLRHLHKHTLGKLLTENGEPNTEAIKKLFDRIDSDSDGSLSYGELRALIVGIEFEEIVLDHEDAVHELMKDFDTSLDLKLSKDEFVDGISRWLKTAKRSRGASGDAGSHAVKFFSDFHMETKREHDLLDVRDRSDVKDLHNTKWVCIKAVVVLLLGTIIAIAFADPLVNAVDNFSTATSIPTFFVSFIALPLAANSSEAMSVILSASRNKRQTASLIFSELYGDVTMGNGLNLSVILALVYVRGLTWDFSSEVLAIVVVSLLVGALASLRTTFPLWTSIPAILLYPFSLTLVCVLNYRFGWS